LPDSTRTGEQKALGLGIEDLAQPNGVRSDTDRCAWTQKPCSSKLREIGPASLHVIAEIGEVIPELPTRPSLRAAQLVTAAGELA